MGGAADLDNRSSGSDEDLGKASLTSPAHRYHVSFPEENKASLVKEASAWLGQRGRKTKQHYAGLTWLTWLETIIPCVGWLKTYKVKEYLMLDVIAGLSVAAMVVPQGLSYAKVAGVPSVWGLYGAFVPCLVYALFGSSRQLAVGPVAVTSLLLGTGIPDIVGNNIPITVFSTSKDAFVAYNANAPGPFAPDQDKWNYAAVQVAFIAGLFYTATGLLRLGWLTNFLSHAVISGFMTGAAIIIALQQVKYFLGINIVRHDSIVLQFQVMIDAIDGFQWRCLVEGLSWLFILEAFKFIANRYKRFWFLRALGPLTVSIISIAITNIWHMQNPPYNIPVVGHIAKGLPSFTAGWWFPLVGSTGQTLKLALIVCAIDIMESISIAKALAIKNRYSIVPTRELRGLGFANLAGAMFHCYTTTGSFSRSAVNNLVGAKTQLAGFITGLAVMVVLLCLTGVFTNMPNSAQGAIIISGVITLFDFKEALFLFKINFFDFVVWCTALCVTLFAGIDKGIYVSIGLALLIVLYKVGFPHTAVLGQLPGTSVWRNVKQYPEATPHDGLLVVRLDTPLYFANVNPIREALEKNLARYNAAGNKVHYLIIDFSPVSDVDGSAIHFLIDFIDRTEDEGVKVIFSNPNATVVKRLDKAGIPNKIGRDYVFVRTQDAVNFCEEVLVETGEAKGKHGL